MKERIKHLILLFLLIGIDQVTKYLVRTNLINNKPIIIIPDVLNLQYSENTGAVWGILSGKMDFLKIFTLIILIVIVFLYFKIPDGKRFGILKLLAVFMIAGAIGNMVDRFLLGHVVDFIYFEIIDFPLFNFADSCLTVASIVLFLLALFYYKDDDFAFLEKSFHRNKKSSDKQGQDE
jgi:signal peptidase II